MAEDDRFARGIALVQVAATVAAVGATVAAVILGAYFAKDQKKSELKETGQAIKEAYAAQFRVVARGIEDMLKCREKLPPFATGAGTRVAFADMKSLGAVMKAKELEAVVEASDELNRLFPPTYSAPQSSTAAAYQAWNNSTPLQSRVKAANEKMRPALEALGTSEEHTNPCYGRRRKARLAEAAKHR